MTEHVRSLFVNPSTITTDDESLTTFYFDKNVTFESFQFHPSLQKVIRTLGYVYPSLVQSKTIPYIMEGRNVIVRAQTGTGKTAAYLLPILHKLVHLLEDTSSQLLTAESRESALALVLVPTNQLVPQVGDVLRVFLKHIPSLRIASFSDDNKTAADEQHELQQIKLSPHVIVSTPDRLLHHLTHSKLSFLTSLRFIVFDEADLFISHGYKDTLDDLIKNHLPKQQLQSILMSATFTPEVQELRSMAVHNPVVIKLNDENASKRLHQFYTAVYEHEKYLVFYSHLLQGMYNRKTIFFVNTIETAFKLKLFLNQFGVPSVVLNDDLPFNSRRNIILQFNRGVFKYLIATDLTNSEISTDAQYNVNVSRGIDFQDVHTVVNFDLPLNFEAYTHRIGRTARAGKVGVAVSYVTHGKEQELFDDMNLKRSVSESANVITATTQNIEVLHVDPHVMDSLRVRVGEALSRTGARVVKEARLEAIRRELLNSQRLAKHWELHPDEMVLLNHQSHQPLTKHTAKTIKQLPEYLKPKSVMQFPVEDDPDAAKNKRKERARLYAKKSKSKNPLKTFMTPSELKASKDTDKSDKKDKKSKKAGKHQAKRARKS